MLIVKQAQNFDVVTLITSSHILWGRIYLLINELFCPLQTKKKILYHLFMLSLELHSETQGYYNDISDFKGFYRYIVKIHFETEVVYDSLMYH